MASNLNSNTLMTAEVKTLIEKWKPVLDHKDLPKITDPTGRMDIHRYAQTAKMLENQEKYLKETAPSNVMGGSAVDTRTGNIQGYDPVLISMVRRALPNLVAYDLCGVQAMSAPVGLIFALRAKSGAPGTMLNGTDEDAFLVEANGGLSGSSTVAGTQYSDPLVAFSSSSLSNRYNSAGDISLMTNGGMSTATGEGNIANEMSFDIDRIAVTAKTRNLKASYSIELAQDLKNLHGLDAEAELVNILSAEVLAEINREVIRTINITAKAGCKSGQTTNPGIFDLTLDAAGRWSQEKFAGLAFQMQREANVIAKETRRGKGNVLLCSSDVADALTSAKLLNAYNPGVNANLTVDDTGNTYVGTMGKMKVFIDPYANNTTTDQNYATVIYRGSNPIDAGIFYCPYVPLQLVRAVDPLSLQPIIGFRTRYGIVSNPFVNSTTISEANAGGLFPNTNQYFRIMKIINLLHTASAQ